MTTRTVLWIKADTNDADYITSENLVQKGDIKIIQKVCEVLRVGKWHHNWVTNDYCTEKESPWNAYKDELTEYEIDVFNEYVPYGEYGIHTIKSVELREITVLEKLL